MKTKELTLRLWDIRSEMESNELKPELQWRNLRLLRDAYEIIKQLPPCVEGCYKDEAGKAVFLHVLVNRTSDADCASLAIEIRTLIDDIFTAAEEDVRLEYDDIWKENNRLLAKRKQYLDTELSMEEYCKIHGVIDWFDPIMRTSRWEEIAYDVYREVYENLGNPALYGDYYYAMSLLEQKDVLLKYGIRWKDVVDMHPLRKLRYFYFTVDGTLVATDYKELYHAYKAVNALEEMNPETFRGLLEEVASRFADWLRRLETQDLEPGEIELAASLAKTVSNAVKAYDNEPEYLEFPLQMIYDTVMEANDLEHRLRFGFMDSTAASPESSDLRKETFKLINEVVSIHREVGGYIDNGCIEKEQKVVDNLQRLIEEYGHHDLYLYRSFLMACNNWYRNIVTRGSGFKIDLLDAVNHYGALSPGDSIGWMVMQEVVLKNPRLDFMDDMDRFYDIVSTAVEEGDQEVFDMALEVRNAIWEPEETVGD